MPIGDETPLEWAAAGLREEAVRRLVALPAEERTRDLVAREARRIGISTSTMFRLLAAWRDAAVRSTLLPEPRGPKRGSLRTPLAKRQIINEAIDRLFLRREAPRISDLCDEIEARCRLGGLTPPSRATVERHVAALDQRRTAKRRRRKSGKSQSNNNANLGLRPTQSQINVQRTPYKPPSPGINVQPTAMAAVNGLTKDGLFIGQSNEFFELLADLASDADNAQRGG